MTTTLSKLENTVLQAKKAIAALPAELPEPIPAEVMCACCPLLEAMGEAVPDHVATYQCDDCGVAVCDTVFQAHKMVLTAATHHMTRLNDKDTDKEEKK
jgi:hypothetical protein